MATDLDLIQQEVPRDSIRASAAGVNMAVAVTESQLVVGRAGPCGQRELRRYPLTALTAIRFLRDWHGDLLALEFDRTDSRVVLFARAARTDAEALVSLLKCPVKKVIQFERPSAGGHRYATAA
jgi:hypothetical protein